MSFIASHLTKPEDRVRVSSLMRSSRLLDLDVTGYAPIYASSTPLANDDSRPHYTPSRGHDWDAHFEAVSKGLTPASADPADFDITRAAKRSTDGYGAFLGAWIDLRARQLVAMAQYRFLTGSEYPFEYELSELFEADELQDRLSPTPDFQALRSCKAGRELLAHWKARATWREMHHDPQLDVDGFAPQDDEVTELEKRLTMNDEEFRYATEAHPELDGEQLQRFEDQDAFYCDAVTRRQRQYELYDLLRERGVDVHGKDRRAVQVFVQKRVAAKRKEAAELKEAKLAAWIRGEEEPEGPTGDLMARAYLGCIYMIRQGYFTGFRYDGWEPKA